MHPIASFKDEIIKIFTAGGATPHPPQLLHKNFALQSLKPLQTILF